MARATVWIGGSTGSGKTTVTRLLAARHGLRVFPIDAFWHSHVDRLGEAADEPTPDEQWLGMTPAEQAADFEALTRRRWPFVCECGGPACTATAFRSIPEFDASSQVLALGHGGMAVPARTRSVRKDQANSPP